jgi:hypothetical protein
MGRKHNRKKTLVKSTKKVLSKLFNNLINVKSKSKTRKYRKNRKHRKKRSNRRMRGG